MSPWRKFNSFWIKIIGTSYDYPLEFRIFHSICAIALVALAYNVPFNYFIGLPKVALISFVVLAALCYLYYLSRFKNKVNISVVLFALTGNLLFVGNYFINSGINGPTDILMSVCLFLILSTVPVKQYKVWIPLNVTAIIALHAIQYFYPHLVPESYLSAKDRFWDMSSAYLVVVALMYYTITYIRKITNTKGLLRKIKPNLLASRLATIIATVAGILVLSTMGLFYLNGVRTSHRNITGLSIIVVILVANIAGRKKIGDQAYHQLQELHEE